MSLKAYKYRIYPNKEQSNTMNKFFGCCRFVYNKCIDWYSDAYKTYKENGTDIGNTPFLTVFKKQHDFLKECDNAAIAYARSNFDKALKEFFKSKKGERKGKRVGFPKYKKKHKTKATYRTCDAHGGIRFDEEHKHIRLPKIGWVKCVYHRECEGIIKAVTVERKRSGRFYISILTEVDGVEKPILNKRRNIEKLNVVGLDMSLFNFVVSSNDDDDTIIKYVKNYRKEENRLARLQRKMSRKQKDSQNRFKQRIKIGRLSEKISNRRKDFCIKTVLYFARKYDAIVLEDLNMQDMARSLHLGKSVNDLGFGIFKQWLKYECQKYDTTIMFCDKWFASSKTCSECGEVYKPLQLSDREWVCPHCGTIHNRDKNAARNIESYFFKVINTEGTSEIHAFGDNASTLRETLSQVLSLKKEAPSFRLE